MVDFRYHLVSIIAVFLALALGIVLGTTALNGQVLDNLQGSIGTLTREKRSLETTISDLRSQTASDEQLAEQVGPAAVQGQLTGRRVVLVTAPNASSGTAADLEPLLESAGATVTGTVQLRPDLLDPAAAATVAEVVGQVAPAGLTLPSADPVDRAATVLAAALVSGGSDTGLSSTAAAAVLAAFDDRDLVDAPDDLGAPAELAVVVAGDPVVSSDPDVPAARARALLTFAQALDEAGDGAVVGGPLAATQDNGAIRALRADGSLSERLSSVDGADRAPGRLAVVFALREQADGGSGRYGSGPGNQGPLPSLPAR